MQVSSDEEEDDDNNGDNSASEESLRLMRWEMDQIDSAVNLEATLKSILGHAIGFDHEEESSTPSIKKVLSIPKLNFKLI